MRLTGRESQLKTHLKQNQYVLPHLNRLRPVVGSSSCRVVVNSVVLVVDQSCSSSNSNLLTGFPFEFLSCSG